VKADVLFSLTNYLPSDPAVPSLLLVQHAGHFSQTFRELQEKEFPGLLSRLAWRFKSSWVRSSVSAATLVTLQTAALADAIRNDMDLPETKLHVIPHGLGICTLGSAKNILAQDVCASALSPSMEFRRTLMSCSKLSPF